MKISSSFSNLLQLFYHGYIFSKCAIPYSWAQSASSQGEDVKKREQGVDGPGLNKHFHFLVNQNYSWWIVNICS